MTRTRFKTDSNEPVVQAAAVPVVVTFTANPPTPAATQTIADGTIPTVAELGQWVANAEVVMIALGAEVTQLRAKLGV